MEMDDEAGREEGFGWNEGRGKSREKTMISSGAYLAENMNFKRREMNSVGVPKSFCLLKHLAL
jgi:hypothetical protein